MTDRWERRAVRVAWGIGLFCLGFRFAGSVLAAPAAATG